MNQLRPNTEYHFVFWLNGGENDCSDETCTFEVLFTDNSMRTSESDWEQRLCYKLNRSYIKPLKRYKGWELYDIPFNTNERKYTQLRFASQRGFKPNTTDSLIDMDEFSEMIAESINERIAENIDIGEIARLLKESME